MELLILLCFNCYHRRGDCWYDCHSAADSLLFCRLPCLCSHKIIAWFAALIGLLWLFEIHLLIFFIVWSYVLYIGIKQNAIQRANCSKTNISITFIRN